MCSHRLPRQCLSDLAERFGRTATLLAGIRAGGDNLCRLPKRLFKALSGMCDRSGAQGLVRLTVAGAAQVRCGRAFDPTLLLPVELRRVNHTSSTNSDNFNDKAFSHLKMPRPCHKHP